MRGPFGGGLVAAGGSGPPDFPATLPGLALWLDGRMPGFTAESTIATAPYGRVSRIAQPHPLTGNWTSSGVNQPWRETNALDFHYDNPTTLVQPAAPPLPANNCTIACAFQTRLGQGLSSPFGFSVGGGSFGFYYAGGVLNLAYPGGLMALPDWPTPWLAASELISFVTLIVACRASTFEVWSTVDGTPYHTTVNQVPASGMLSSPLVLGEYSGVFVSNAHCAMSEWIAYTQAQTADDCLALQAWLLEHLPGNPPTSAPLIASFGDSIDAGWPASLQPTFDDSPTPPRWVNSGVVGAHNTIPTEIPAFFQDNLTPLYSSARAKNILIIEGISVNDVAFLLSAVPPKTPLEAATTIVDAYFNTCDTAKAAGWIGIVMTLLPTTTTIDGFDECRALINTRIRAEWATHGAAFYDIGATPGMSTRADAAGPFFLDGTHPSPSGYVQLNTTLGPVLASVLNS